MKMTEKTLQQLEKLHRSGCSIKMCAEVAGVGPEVVAAGLKKRAQDFDMVLKNGNLGSSLIGLLEQEVGSNLLGLFDGDCYDDVLPSIEERVYIEPVHDDILKIKRMLSQVIVRMAYLVKEAADEELLEQETMADLEYEEESEACRNFYG